MQAVVTINVGLSQACPNYLCINTTISIFLLLLVAAITDIVSITVLNSRRVSCVVQYEVTSI